jgi:hypothetical protein
MEPEGSVPNSQELSTCSYPEPDQSSPHRPIPSLWQLAKEKPVLRQMKEVEIDKGAP